MCNGYGIVFNGSGVFSFICDGISWKVVIFGADNPKKPEYSNNSFLVLQNVPT